MLPVLINRMLVTKGFPHVTRVPSIIRKPRRENIDPIKPDTDVLCVCVDWTLSSKPLNPGALKRSFKGICCVKEPLELMRCVCVSSWEGRDSAILLGSYSTDSFSHEAQ